MISTRNFLRASRRNIETAQRMLAEPEFLKAEAKRITGDSRKTSWLRRDAQTLLRQCAAEGVSIGRPYKVVDLAGKKALLTVFWPSNASSTVLVPAKFY